MKAKSFLLAAGATLAFGLGSTTLADAKSITLPAETVQLSESAARICEGADQLRVVSLGRIHAVSTPTAPRGYWDAMVTRMKVVFKAPIDDADMPAIVDYLVKTYGNEQPK